MRTFAARLLGLAFLSSLGACCIEPVGAVYGGRTDAACYDDAVGQGRPRRVGNTWP